MPDVQRALPVNSAPVNISPLLPSAQTPSHSADTLPQTAPVIQTDSSQVKPINGPKMPAVVIDTQAPKWSPATQALIRYDFHQGLNQYGITPQELNQVLRRFEISSLQVNEKNIQNPEFADEVKRIQTALGMVLNHPTLLDVCQTHTVSTNGQFGANTVQALAALRDSIRGEAIELHIQPFQQQNGQDSHQTVKAMFNQYGCAKENTDTFAIQVHPSINIMRDQAMLALEIIDEELEAGNPVIAGISYRQLADANSDLSEHFILITGRNRDEVGTYYSFNDPVRGTTSQLRLDAMTGRLSGKDSLDRTYDLSLIQTTQDTVR